jgi:ubiquinone/menaquinone biosynthesis C-methylase UbiE
MIERAIALTNDPAIEYRHLSIEQLQLIDDPYDAVVSSLAMHYVEDYCGAVRRIARLLKAGGRLAFSADVHCTAPATMDKGRCWKAAPLARRQLPSRRQTRDQMVC